MRTRRDWCHVQVKRQGDESEEAQRRERPRSTIFGNLEKHWELAREKTSAASEAVEGVGSVNKGLGRASTQPVSEKLHILEREGTCLARNQSVKNWGAKVYKVHYLYMFGSVHRPSS